MESLPLGLVYTWRHREWSGSAIPIHARSIKNGVALQYLDGTIRIYRRTHNHGLAAGERKENAQANVSYTPITVIIGDVGNRSAGLNARGVTEPNVNYGAAYVSAIEVSKYETPSGERECLFASRAGGIIRKYDIPSGRLLVQSSLPFECRGLNAHMNHKLLIAWGYSCEMVVLDQVTLQIKGRWTSLPDWPLPTSLFDDQVLVFFKSGMASYWKIHADRNTYDTVQQVKQPHPMIRLPPPPTPKPEHVSDHKDDGSFEPKMLKSRKQSVITMFDRSHGFDPLITVKQVSENSWLVARRHGWMLYKWENGTLVDEISADVSEGIISIITADSIESEQSTSFGVLTRASKVIWVSDGNVQVIEPIWNVKNDEIITCAVYSKEDNLLSCYVVTEHGINMYSLRTGPWPLSWDTKPFRLQTFKKTITYVSGVLGDDVVVGKGPDLMLFTPEMFLSSSEGTGKILYSLDDAHKVTTLECIKETEEKYLIAAGTSDGRLITVNAKSSQVELSLQIFATSVTHIVKLTAAIAPLYQNFMLLVSLDSSVALVDRSSKKVWKCLPSSSLKIISISFTKQNVCWIVIQYEDKSRRIWDLDTDEEIDDITFYESLLPAAQFDKMSISSLTSTRRTRIDQAHKNRELDKLDNILYNKGPLLQRDHSLLVSPPTYARSPLMVIRSDLLIQRFSEAVETGDDGKAKELYPTAKAICSSIFHLPSAGTSAFDEFIAGLCPKSESAHEELGVGMLTTALLHSNSSPSEETWTTNAAFDMSLFCMDTDSSTTLLEIDGETSAAVIVVWISLVQTLAKYSKIDMPDAAEIYNRIISLKGIEKPNLGGFARLLLAGKGEDELWLLVL